MQITALIKKKLVASLTFRIENMLHLMAYKTLIFLKNRSWAIYAKFRYLVS